jgi:hypothetical protein
MKAWTKAAIIGLLCATIAGCSSGPKIGDPDKTGDPISLNLTGPQLTKFSNKLANKLRGERFFVKAVADMRAKLGQPPNLGFDTDLRNRTTQDDLDMIYVYNGFQEAFYTSDKVSFKKNVANPHLKLVMRLSEQRNYSDDGERVADYTARLKVKKLILSDDPDAPAMGTELIGIVSDRLRITDDKLVF